MTKLTLTLDLQLLKFGLLSDKWICTYKSMYIFIIAWKIINVCFSSGMKIRHWLFFDWIYESKLVCTYNVILSFVWRAPSQCTSNKVMLMVNVKGEMIFRMQSTLTWHYHHTALYIDLTLYMHALYIYCSKSLIYYNYWL